MQANYRPYHIHDRVHGAHFVKVNRFDRLMMQMCFRLAKPPKDIQGLLHDFRPQIALGNHLDNVRVLARRLLGLLNQHMDFRAAQATALDQLRLQAVVCHRQF